MQPRLDFYTLLKPSIQHLLGIEKALADAELPPALIKLVKLRASQLNGCGYCLHLHVTEALAAGEAIERLGLVAAWRESTLFSARERAALRWTEEVTLLAGQPPSDAAYAELEAHFSAQEIAQLTLAVGMINLWNRMAVALRAVHPDKPLRYLRA
jgi:AhpD family alkylhydroperoxidase